MSDKENLLYKPKLIIFDMDGVLVDVSHSYRLAIKKTAEFFLGVIIDNEQIERLKLCGGYNDDYDCTDAILKNHGRIVSREIIIKKFQEYYLGKPYRGLIENEKWMLEKSILSTMAKKYKLAIFTGRPKNEANYTLKNSTTVGFFNPVITAEDTPNKKPNPEGINLIMNILHINSAVYIGDTLDDLLAARAANIEFIGVIAPGCDRVRLRSVLRDNGSKIVLEDINSIVKIL